jgi:hypothetical protein
MKPSFDFSKPPQKALIPLGKIENSVSWIKLHSNSHKRHLFYAKILVPAGHARCSSPTGRTLEAISQEYLDALKTDSGYLNCWANLIL